VAERWARDGNRVVLLDLAEEGMAKAVDSLGSELARGIRVDVTDTANVDAAFGSIGETEGRLDAVVNCAGIAKPGPSATITDADWSRMLDIHVSGSLRACRAGYQLLQGSDRAAIVNLASVAALTGMPKRASYTTAKAAVVGLTRTLAVEWAPDGIRVNAVGPGYVRTALTSTLIVAGQLDDAPIKARTPLQRFADPSEIAEAINFLCSPAASYITGHLLMVDGGMTIDGNWY